MKKNYLFAISSILLCLALLALCACGTIDPPAAPDEPAPVELALSTGIYEDGTDYGFTNTYVYGSDGYEKNYITVNTDVTGVEIIPVSMNDDGSYYASAGAVAVAERLAVGEALVLDLDIPELIPNCALSLSCNGVQHCYLLGYNGNVGGLSIMETVLGEKISTESYVVDVYRINENCDGVETTSVDIGVLSPENLFAAVKMHCSAIPSDCVVNSFDSQTGALDLSSSILYANAGTSEELYMLDSIAFTFCSVYGCESVMITADGGVYESGHIILDEPIVFAAE